MSLDDFDFEHLLEYIPFVIQEDILEHYIKVHLEFLEMDTKYWKQISSICIDMGALEIIPPQDVHIDSGTKLYVNNTKKD